MLPLFFSDKLYHISDRVATAEFSKYEFAFWHMCICSSICLLSTSALIDYKLLLSRVFLFMVSLTLKYTVPMINLTV